MSKFLCWLLGHDRLETNPRYRVCLRCGKREKRCQYGAVVGWEELPAALLR